MQLSPEFSPEGYSSLISSFRSVGYEVKSYIAADPAKKHLIVRHDVDFSLEAALAMAEQERALGVSSTYFVLLRTEFYNPLSRDGLLALRRIKLCGHDIGLHFDAALYSADAIEQAAALECSMLENIIEHSVTTISFHRPLAGYIGKDDRIAGRLNAYGARYVKEIGYCSDSRGAWSHGEPRASDAFRSGRALQLLVHPFWWQAPIMAPENRLRSFLSERARFLDRELARHCMIHRERPA